MAMSAARFGAFLATPSPLAPPPPPPPPSLPPGLVASIPAAIWRRSYSVAAALQLPPQVRTFQPRQGVLITSPSTRPSTREDDGWLREADNFVKEKNKLRKEAEVLQNGYANLRELGIPLNQEEVSNEEFLSRPEEPVVLESPEKVDISAQEQCLGVSEGVKEEGQTADDIILSCSMEEVLIVNNISAAKEVVRKLMVEYRDRIHACDTEVSDIAIKKQSPVGHGTVICFSIYCGPSVDFGGGKDCLWIDVLEGGEGMMDVFKEYFEDEGIKKVWHNYSFDRHVLGNHGISTNGFYADTMHLARLWHSGRKDIGYSLESLTSDPVVMDSAPFSGKGNVIKKTSMKDLFAVKKVNKDGSEGKIKVMPSVIELQTNQCSYNRWVCYSASDAVCTWKLWYSLRAKLEKEDWNMNGMRKGSMHDFYLEYWRPFGALLVDMEANGFLVDTEYLAKVEKDAMKEQERSVRIFRKWARDYCSDAQFMNVGSDLQVRQLLFGGNTTLKGKKGLPKERVFQVPNVEGLIEEGRKIAKKTRSITIRGIDVNIPTDHFTSSGFPQVSMPALKAMAGKVSLDYIPQDEEKEDDIPESIESDGPVLTSDGVHGVGDTTKGICEDTSVYGTAYNAFGGGIKGIEACKAIAAICEVSAINTLISSFIQPLQGGDIAGPDKRIHCSMNLNTETGRLSARRPNLQNQPALEKDRYKIRQAFVASPGKYLIVADYGQLELRILAHLSNCKSMLRAFKMGGDFHSRTAMNMYDYIRKAVDAGDVILEWEPKPGEKKPPVPLLKDKFAAERRKAKMLNFSIAYGKTPIGLAKDWNVTVEEAKKTVELWYKDRSEVRGWQEKRKMEARKNQRVYTLLGRPRHFPSMREAAARGHIERAAINSPVQGSAADVAMCAMLEINKNSRLKELGWKLILQVHDEVILEGPKESADEAKKLVIQCMSFPFNGKNTLNVDLVVDAKYAENWYAAK